MNVQQRQAIHRLRGEGLSYAKISALTGISENTVKSYCRRNDLGSVATEIPDTPVGSFCRQCGSPLTQTKGSKPKRFCSDKCRMTWWNSHPDAVNHKLVRQITCPEILFPYLLRQVKGGENMSKGMAIIHYRASMCIFNSWASKGIISKEELLTIDTIIAQKYGLSFDSIYRL